MRLLLPKEICQHTRTFKGKFMAESRLTTRNHTTVPAVVRKALGMKPGTRLVWHVMPDGNVLVRAKSKSLLELAGTVESPGKGVTIEDMKAWRR
ncbi:AbrB/MazE/SpoVT family DNA-binding domain-containing protein [Paraburkholderia sp. SIMBA_030]|uniref:AbrB/MazE/SpoVT family DNA-binding domain-containing protein n=1 Tax=Paraburkholderia sp. SIMBA_030 TaxID=3085773 RepID=UPI00397C8888